MEQINPDLIERSVQNIYSRVGEYQMVDGGNFNICVKFYY
jgi:hypothetical protein